jgi:hypothetical protein
MSFIRAARASIREDLDAAMRRDPAAENRFDVAVNSPGLHAIWAYRGLHRLWNRPGGRAPARALSTVVQELGLPETTRFRVVVEGHPQALAPLIRDEVYRIAREALVNAIRHADARLIEVTLDYRPERFIVTIRDDGIGIADQDVLASGRDRHWGLAGMRERAAAVGATLKLLSRSGAGTEIELSVPGRVAFPSEPSARRPWWVARRRR